MTALDAADAADALLITGGFPEIVQAWEPGVSRLDYLRRSVANPLSPLLAAGELSLLGEFPAVNWRCRASNDHGRAGAVVPWSRSSVSPCCGCCRTMTGRRPRRSAAGGTGGTIPEIDLVGTDRGAVAGRVQFVGSVKWLETQPFGRREYDGLVRDLLAVPGAEPGTPLVAVSRCGVTGDLPRAAHWGPGDLVRAWR
jgi:hypothetical protein